MCTAPADIREFVRVLERTKVIEPRALSEFLAKEDSVILASDLSSFVERLVKYNLITDFRAQLLLLGQDIGYCIGHYQIVDLIGKGGMGSVFLALDRNAQKHVAIKIMPPYPSNSTLRERFILEAKATQLVRHPHIVQAMELGEQDGLLYLVMEYIRGIDLQRYVWISGPLDPGLACGFVWQASLGLEAIHHAGLIHRDLKPSNLIVDDMGQVKILDLGLVFDTNRQLPPLTKANGAAFIGTLEYLAPEQLQTNKTVDPRIDIFTLGGSLYYLLTGRHPRANETPLTPMKALTMPIEPINKVRPELPLGLVEVMQKMMQLDPNERYATALEAAQAIYPWVEMATLPRPLADLPRSTSNPRSAVTQLAVTRPLTPPRSKSWGGAVKLGLLVAVAAIALMISYFAWSLIK